MGKRKKVTFNVFRPYLEEYKGPNISKEERFNFSDFIEGVQGMKDIELSTVYQDEKLILQKAITHEPNLIHIQILKQRVFDLPYQIKKNSALRQTIEENVINYDSTYEEEAVKVDKGSFLGEVMVLLYDMDSNTIVVQSNRNCTSLKGIVTLFSTIYNDSIITSNNPDEYSVIDLVPILNEPLFDQASSLETYSELEVTVEDNDRFKNAESIINGDNTLGAQRIKMSYYLDTNKDKKASLLKKQVKDVIKELRNKNKTIKSLNVKGRITENDVIEKFELVRDRLYFTHDFTATQEVGTLNPSSVITEMANKYKTKKIGSRTIQELSKL